MRKIDGLLEEYGVSHQNPTNKTIHWFCVPAIFFSIVGLIYSIPPERLVWATITLLLVLYYYVTLSVPLALGMFLFASVCLAMANLLTLFLPIPLWLFSLILFIVAWVFQFYGHKIEGKKPSFFKDVQFLLIGPAWLMHFIYKRLGIGY